MVSKKQALVQQIKMVNIGCVCACAHVCGVRVCESVCTCVMCVCGMCFLGERVSDCVIE